MNIKALLIAVLCLALVIVFGTRDWAVETTGTGTDQEMTGPNQVHRPLSDLGITRAITSQPLGAEDVRGQRRRTIRPDDSPLILHPLWDAVDRRDLATVHHLLSTGGDPNSLTHWGSTVLHLAVASGQKEMVDLLISAGAKIDIVNAKGLTPLAIELKMPDLKMVRFLVRHGAKLDHRHLSTVLNSGALDRYREVVGLGVQVNQADGWSPLFGLACKVGEEFVELASFLISRGANVNARDPHGTTPLLSVSDSNLPMARLLIANGADINAATSEGLTLLHMVVAKGHAQSIPMAQLLLTSGANVNARRKDGLSPLGQLLNPETKRPRIGVSKKLIALLRKYGGTK